ncbi:hypothetical protein AAGS61_02805 [Lysinibacillus sp. KU-BSD001]|uniref:hypothetical protein n=1 Tax=Lysinibacillus sp. KU-BSD001 TaxID=3141328 RepID=UPI0036F160B0
MFIYRSPIGTFSIRVLNGRYALCFANDVLGCYNSAGAAADDVYTHTTGHDKWDALDCRVNDVPTDIYEWEKI